MQKQYRPFGFWDSPISPRALASKFRFLDVQWDSNGERLVWVEQRGKQNVLVVQDGLQASRDLTTELSVRAGVGYGGGEFTVCNGIAYFVSGGRLYRQSLDAGREKAITPPFGAVASPSVSADGRWLAYIYHHEDLDGLALVDTDGELWPRKLASDTDFAMQPVWNPRGNALAYVAWNFPNMPWDGTELRLATLEADRGGVPAITRMEMIAGGLQTSVSQPLFSPDGRMLAYVSDSTGWGQLYVYDLADGTHTRVTSGDVEFGIPSWTQGIRTYGWTHDSRALLAVRSDQGVMSLWRLDVSPRRETKLEGFDEYTYFTQLSLSPTRNAIAAIAASGVITERVISFEPDEMRVPLQLSDAPDAPRGLSIPVEESRGQTIHRRSSSENIAETELAKPQPIQWISFDGEAAYGLYYAPASAEFESPGAPPLIVYVHGGPTSQARATYSPSAQFFATRGFAVLEVNHRGSTGYGRPYQDKLRGAWGIYDVEDSASGAAALADFGLADTGKCVIMGGSAGGYTVLQSLVKKPGFYRAGICAYGVSNQFTLQLESEFKFESQYSYSLLGMLPDSMDVWRERSPVFYADKISDPVILFQGTDDKVVPKAQSDAIVNTLKARRVPHEYHVFEGEGHGWRKPETIEAYYKLSMDFLKRYVLFG